MSNPAVTFGRSLLPSLMGRSSFYSGPKARQPLQTLIRVLRMGGRPSHLIFVELRKAEVRRMPLPRTPVNKGKKEDRGVVPRSP
jgi:hypothetical protein